MDAANLRQQDQLPGSSIGTPSFHEVSNNHLWNQIFMLNGENSSDSSTPTLKMFQPGFNGVISSSRGLIQTSPTLGYNINSSSINQDVGFNWSPSNSQSYTNHSNQELQFAKIKQELSDSFPNYSGTVSDPSILEGLFLAASAGYIKNEQDLQELNEKLSLKSSSNLHGSCGDVYNNNTHQSSANFGGVATCSSSTNWRGQDLNSMNMQALDLLDSAKFGGILSNPNQNNLSLIREHGCFGLNLQEQNHRPYNNQQKMPTFINEAPEARRCSSSTEPKTFETTHKKPRYEHTSSFPPFKVRKEKLGDRITALQQLVAPFGKTDTASVLLEAIGYIKFLQDQVETLSVPYMNASGDSSSRTQGASLKGSSSIEENKERNEPTRDLRSRGLCLVPLSCTSHVTDDIVGAVWPPSNFGGGI